MTDHKPLSEGEMEPWVMVKRGLFYRADYHGYTSNIAQAGRYSRKLAEECAAIEPERIKAFPLSHFREQAQRAFDEAKAALEQFESPIPKPLDGEAVADIRAIIVEIIDQYENQNLSHVDFRVGAKLHLQIALTKLDALARSTQKEATEEEPERLIREYLAAHPDAALGVIDMRRIWAEHGIRLVKVPHDKA